MGLFGPKYHCALCSKKAGKMDSFLSDGSKMCSSCERDLASSYFKVKFRKKHDDWCSVYPDYDAKKMYKVQEFYMESKKRANEFITTYRKENFVLDATHGYFAICADKIDASIFKKNMKHSSVVEVFQINDVIKLECRLDFSSNKQAQIIAHFKEKQLPYDINSINIQGKLIETKKALTNRGSEMLDEISKFFPGIKLQFPETPEEKKRRLFEGMFQNYQSYVFDLAFTREELNKKIDMVMTLQLPDKYKPLAKRYLYADSEFMKACQSFSDISNFLSEDDVIAQCDKAKDYIEQMTQIYNQFDSFVVSELDKQAAKMRKGK